MEEFASQYLMRVMDERKEKIKNDPTYQRLQEQIQSGNPTPASTYLDNIHKFSENCQRRRYMERRIRQDRGLSPNEAVEIPSPGVPPDAPRLVVQEDGHNKVINGDGSEDEFSDQEFSDGEGYGPDMSWAADQSDFSDGSNDRSL